MKWSRLKQRFEARLARCLQGRLQVHVTEYRTSSLDHGRGWVVFDGHELVSVYAPAFMMRVGRCEFDVPGPRDGFFDLGRAVGDMESISAQEALQSPNPILQGLALLNAGAGKRTLATVLSVHLHPFAQLMLATRLYAEGLSAETPSCPSCGENLLAKHIP